MRCEQIKTHYEFNTLFESLELRTNSESNLRNEKAVSVIINDRLNSALVPKCIEALLDALVRLAEPSHFNYIRNTKRPRPYLLERSLVHIVWGRPMHRKSS